MAKFNFLKGRLKGENTSYFEFCSIMPNPVILEGTEINYMNWSGAAISNPAIARAAGTKLELLKKGLHLVTGCALLNAFELPADCRHMLTLTSDRPNSDYYIEGTTSELNPFSFMSQTMQIFIDSRATNSYLQQAVYIPTTITPNIPVEIAPMLILYLGQP